jgi:serine/threonine-protein phosphatase 2A regulatory subunit A
VIGIENLQESIIPSLTELSQDKNWRIKLSVVQQFPVLARQLGEQFYNDKLNPISQAWLQDSIFTIREAAIENFKELAKIFGAQWASRFAIPKLILLQTDANYLHR